ncbi:uncharacterized protein BDW47DRAFT_40489 [Aspergillus candidus]|uniref:Uncharacterized protein n=1 Tax=Aspergillus candidus TaxID=41067 RepID=A0A2I2F949_ASPCN|nr:hypothetical protein BDW47DRAFT_40489 [Aspergillus candidus]PLB37166.1 hypothetical protein BDW47DRAFT_40489 [Aspergillus candidus]
MSMPPPNPTLYLKKNQTKAKSNQVTPNSCASCHMDQVTPYIHTPYSPSLPARLRIAPGYDIVNPHNYLNKRMYVCVQIPSLPSFPQKGRERKEKKRSTNPSGPQPQRSNQVSTAKTSILSPQETAQK